MKDYKDYYAVMGVSPQATAAEVLAAWRTRSAVVHPDRFDRVTQAAQWQQANAMFAELREAHEILGDVRRRAEYDHLRGGAPAAVRQTPRPAKPSPRRRAQHADRISIPDPQLSASRFVEAGSLPPAGLRSLSRDKDSDALFRRNDSGLTNTVGVVLGLAACVLTWFAAFGVRLDALGQLETFAALAGALWLIAFNTLHLWLARVTPFGRGLVVTPYYFAEVRWDRSRLTPLLSLKNVATTHHYMLGVYARTTFRTEWASGSLTFDVASKAESERLSKVLIESANRVRQSFAYGQGESIVKRFAFAQQVETLPREEFKSDTVKRIERTLGVAVAIAATILLVLRPTPPAITHPAMQSPDRAAPRAGQVSSSRRAP